MNWRLRPIAPDELREYIGVVMGAFGGRVEDAQLERWRGWLELDRTLAAFDGDEIVGTAGAFSFDLTVPSRATVSAAGVTAVTVRSTHRRRGILRALMDRQLDDVAARGEPIAVLTASESSIYRRFGYGLATSSWWWRLDTGGGTLAEPSHARGALRLVDAMEAAPLARAVYEQARRRRPGAVSRSPGWWDLWAEGYEGYEPLPTAARFQAVHRGPDGEPDGYATWHVHHLFDDATGLPNGEVHVHDLYALDDEVEAALWEHLLSIDLMRSVHAHNRPVEDPLRWRLTDPRRLHVHRHSDHLWLRLVDVPAALASRTYGSEERFVLSVTDGFRPANAGLWGVELSPDGARCRRATGEPDASLDVADLGALYLGGVSATTLARAGRVHATPDVVARLDRAFTGSEPPWCGTHF